MAIRLSKAFGSTPEFWLKLQFNYDCAQINAKADDIKVERYPPKEMDLETEPNRSVHRALAQHYHDLVYILVQISEIYLYEAKLNDAQRLLNADFLKDIEDRLDPHEIARLQIQRAKVMFYRSYFGPSDHDIALAILYEAEKVAASLGDKGLVADVMDLAGSILYAKEWPGSATLDIPLKYFTQGLALREEAEDQRGIAESLFNIGTVYQNKAGASDEDRQQAFEYFQKAHRLAQGKGFKLEQSYAARHLGFLCLLRRELDQALAYQQECLALRKEIGCKIFLAPTYTMIGVTHHARNEMNQALEHFQSAQMLAKKIGSQRFLAEAFFGIGTVNEAEKDEIGALSYYQQALASARAADFGFVVSLATRKIEALSPRKTNDIDSAA
jgi:tetratricopeptide (TPR) repeat protein